MRHEKTILKAAGPTVIECTGIFSSYALSVQTCVKKATRKMTNNTYWNRKVYFQESDNCVSAVHTPTTGKYAAIAPTTCISTDEMEQLL